MDYDEALKVTIDNEKDWLETTYCLSSVDNKCYEDCVHFKYGLLILILRTQMFVFQEIQVVS